MALQPNACPASAQEIKAKEMEELAKTLAELGIAAPGGQDDTEGGVEAAKKKKKKDRKAKADASEGNGEVPPPETNGTAKENEPMEEPKEDDSAESLDPAEVIPSDFAMLWAHWPLGSPRYIGLLDAMAILQQWADCADLLAKAALYEDSRRVASLQ